MNYKACTIHGRECFISDSVQPRYILNQTLGDHERGIFDRTAELIAGAAGIPFVMSIEEISEDLGFEISTYFIHNSVTPLQYRKSSKE